MNNKLCYLNDLNFNEKQRVNDLCTAGFKRDPSYDMIGSMNNPIVSLVLLNNLIVGVAFANEESYEVMHPLSKKVLYLHTITVDENHRGKGYSGILVDQIMNKYKPTHGMYLHVRTTDTNPNHKAIQCYQNRGFELIDCIHAKRDDGPNTVMVLKKSNAPALRKPRESRESRYPRKKRSQKKKKSKKKSPTKKRKSSTTAF